MSWDIDEWEQGDPMDPEPPQEPLRIPAGDVCTPEASGDQPLQPAAPEELPQALESNLATAESLPTPVIPTPAQPPSARSPSKVNLLIAMMMKAKEPKTVTPKLKRLTHRQTPGSRKKGAGVLGTRDIREYLPTRTSTSSDNKLSANRTRKDPEDRESL